jgi:hypothetical protein
MLTSKEFFVNIKHIPTADSDEYDAFFTKELDKIENGVTVNGIYYPGWLYWHLNHWHIFTDYKDDRGRVKRVISHPELRDNEWILSEHLLKAQAAKRGLLVVGSRRFGKTEFLSSYIGHNSLVYYGSENMYAAANDPDLGKISATLKRGYKKLHPYFKPIFLEDTWKSGSDVVLGFKDSGGERYEYSRLLIRNHNGGRNTEVGAGATLHSLVVEEIGKDNWLNFFDAVKPALESEYGWRCSPVCTGTTGNMAKAKDLQKVYEDMEGFNFITVEINDSEGKKFSFYPGNMSLKFPKLEIPIKEFLGKPEIKCKDTIKVTDWKSSNEILDVVMEELRRKGKYTSLLKERMYYPRTEEDMFLTDNTDNPFADVVEYAQEHLKYLESLNNYEEYGWMTRDGSTGKAKFVKTNVSVPIQNFPTAPDEDRDAPIIVWHHPLPGQEFGVLHVAGSDPYNQDESYYSPSLGTLYIYRRTYDPLNGIGQETFVASYTARPKNIGKWREQVRLLLEYYDCTCLPENEEASFIRWFDEKNIGHYLEDGIDIAKEINPNTKSKRNKGLAATTPNIRYGNGVLRNYCLDDLDMGPDPQGNKITKKGVIRIKDKGLLKEIIGYKVDPATGKAINADRIVGARHALIIAKSKDKYFPIAKVAPVHEGPEKPVKRPKASPFNTMMAGSSLKRKGGGPFGGKGMRR